jgi:glycosyltransferase involved in cell wall biosynthesis
VRPRLHLLGLPHTQTTKEHVVCAFTAKLVKLCEMLEPRGWEIFLYSGAQNEAPCKEHIPLFSDEEQVSWYGEFDPNVLPTVAKFDPNEEPWKVMNTRAIGELAPRLEPHDLLLLLAGTCQKPVADNFPVLTAEWAAGYEGWYTNCVCFESYAWMHHCYGRRNINDGRFFDTVIPNFFRPSDFKLTREKEDYLLFVGRTIYRKGITVAAEIAKEAGLPLVVAGSGVTSVTGGKMKTFDGCEIENVEYVGPVNVEQRNDLMGRARAVFAPTLYIEPFGAVAVEAQLCGTPAITTDWGAYPETVPEGQGFRFRTIAEGVEAVMQAESLDPAKIRRQALKRYSLEAIAPEYERWFDQISTLWGDGFYAKPELAAA